MDDRPRHEAYSYASAGDIEPAEEFPILYRLLTAERKGGGTKRSSSSSFISSNHSSYFPISHHRKRKNNGDNSKKDSHGSSPVEADSTSDISLSHILARNKFINTNYIIGKSSGGKVAAGKGKRIKKCEKGKDQNNDEMEPSSTTNDDDDDDGGDNEAYFCAHPPPKKRTRFPQSLKRALILRKQLQIGQDKNELAETRQQEPLLVSSLSVNQRLAVLLGQQQVNSNETKPPSLVPRTTITLPTTTSSSSSPANIFLNTQSSSTNHSRVNHNLISSHKVGREGALVTLLSRPPSSISHHQRKLIFPSQSPSPCASELQNPLTNHVNKGQTQSPSSFPMQDTKTSSQLQEDQKKVLIKGVVEQLRAAATARPNALFSFKRSLSKSGRNNEPGKIINNSNSNAAAPVDSCLHKCPNCDLTFKRLYHLSRHLSVMHAEAEKFYCSLCSEEFLIKEQFQAHVEECFDVKYSENGHKIGTPSCGRQKKSQPPAGSDSEAKKSSSVQHGHGHGLYPRQINKQYIGLSQLLETKVEESAAFHSFVLPTKYLE